MTLNYYYFISALQYKKKNSLSPAKANRGGRSYTQSVVNRWIEYKPRTWLLATFRLKAAVKAIDGSNTTTFVAYLK